MNTVLFRYNNQKDFMLDATEYAHFIQRTRIVWIISCILKWNGESNY